MTEPATNVDFSNDLQSGEIASRLNWLRAGVMGANDGIVSTAGMVVAYGLRQLTGLIQAQGIDPDALLRTTHTLRSFG